MNLISYIIYLFITSIITFRIGRICFNNGKYYIRALIPDNEHLGDNINRMLLICYYLLNIGYAAVMIAMWTHVDSIQVMISSITVMIGRIVLSLAIIHYINMLVIGLISRFDNNTNHLKNPIS